MEVGDEDVDLRFVAMLVGQAYHWEKGAEKIAEGKLAVDAKAGEDGGGCFALLASRGTFLMPKSIALRLIVVDVWPIFKMVPVGVCNHNSIISLNVGYFS